MSLETKRTSLHAKLLELCPNAYFQPPSNIHMSYPCFVYSFDDVNERHANDKSYIQRDRYTVTYITKEAMPSAVIESLLNFPYSSMDRHYSSDNLHHFAFTLYL